MAASVVVSLTSSAVLAVFKVIFDNFQEIEFIPECSTFNIHTGFGLIYGHSFNLWKDTFFRNFFL